MQHYTAPSSQTHANPRVAAKQAELDGLKQLRDYSAKLVKELEKMGEGLEGVRQGGQCEPTGECAFSNMKMPCILILRSLSFILRCSGRSGNVDVADGVPRHPSSAV